MKNKLLLIILYTVFFLAGKLSAQSVNKPMATLNHLAIYVVDLQKTVSFYNNVFQLDTIPEPFHDNKHAWYRIGPGVSLHVIQGAEKPKEYFLNNHMCFSVPSTTAFIEKLKAQHIPWTNAKGIVGEITTRVDGVMQIWVNDPDGYFIEVNDAKN